jgi:cell division protein ZapA
MTDTRVQVQIQGRTYTLLGGNDPAGIREVAAHVDRRMNEIASQTPTVDSTRLAILAALNITEELFSSRKGGPAAPPRRALAPPDAAPRDTTARDRDLCALLDTVLDVDRGTGSR